MVLATLKSDKARWAETVLARRKALGWSRGTLASLSGVTERTIQNLEKGWHEAHNSTQKWIDQALDAGERRQARRRSNQQEPEHGQD